MDKDDTALILAVKEGSVLSFEILVKRYQKKVFRFVYKILKNETHSEEVVQDAFLSLYKSIDRIDLSKRLSPYLLEIAKNKAYSFLRSQKPTVGLNEGLNIASGETLIDNFIEKDKAHIVHLALKKITKRYQKVLGMYYFDDLSYEEIGKTLQIPINTVRTLLHRGKKELKTALVPYEIY